MSDQYIAEHCAPTLAGLKTANLFSVRIEKHQSIAAELRSLNHRLAKKGLRVIIVKNNGTYALIYVYRPGRLKKDLSVPEAREILQERGYSSLEMGKCIHQLMNRLSKNKDFPHEIGLFLGYPPSDVKGFIHHPDEGVIYAGTWKAYSNAAEAKKKNLQYKKCTQIYCRRLKEGRPLSQMIVGE